MSVSPDPAHVRTGAGTLMWAPLGTAVPATHLVAWPTGWLPIGYTAEGHQSSIAKTIVNIEVAEVTRPIKRVVTAEDIRVGFAMAETTLQNLKLALNGGVETTYVGGAHYEPPELGDEVRIMLGFQAEDDLERIVWRKCLQAGTVTTPRRKGAEFARFPVEFALEEVSGAKPFRHFFDSALLAA